MEPWTRDRRRAHTRELLLDAAEEVFAARGFEGASLDDIAKTAGYTRGAIYKHFANKEELFLAVNQRFNERFLTGFLDLLDPSTAPGDLDIALIAKRWREMQSRDSRAYALGSEFNLYVLRNPHVRSRVADQRRAVAQMVADFMSEQSARLGARFRIPTLTMARIVLAASDGLEMATHIEDGDDLYQPFLELLLSAWEPMPPPEGPNAR
ncbi:MAG: TetR/AcrR family transcriptional regulator [Actinomycetes bacterium]